jgi:hypothetical protein
LSVKVLFYVGSTSKDRYVLRYKKFWSGRILCIYFIPFSLCSAISKNYKLIIGRFSELYPVPTLYRNVTTFILLHIISNIRTAVIFNVGKLTVFYIEYIGVFMMMGRYTDIISQGSLSL